MGGFNVPVEDVVMVNSSCANTESDVWIQDSQTSTVSLCPSGVEAPNASGVDDC